MAKRTEYAAVVFKTPCRVLEGRGKVGDIEATQGVRLVRVTEDGRDDLIIGGKGVPEGTEVPWNNVASGRRMSPKSESKG